MSKKFIDSEIFSDPWFMELSKDGKLGYLYLIANCDCAGIVKVNEKLFVFQTGAKSWATVEEELGNRLARVGVDYLYLTRYIRFQYPKGLNSQSNMIASVVKRLSEFGLWDEENSRVAKELPNPSPTVSQLLGNSPSNSKGKDNPNDSDASRSRPSSEQEVIDYCESIGLTKSDGEYMFSHWEGNGFRNAGKVMKDWKATIRAWSKAGHMPSQKPVNGRAQPSLDLLDLGRGEFR